jgi:arabinofuranosyltransferase
MFQVRNDPMARVAMLLVLLVLAAVLYRTAWVSDDAYITLRTVDNAWHGLGLRWNAHERVAAFTHPLWMGVLWVAHGISGEAYLSTVVAGASITLLATAGCLLRAKSLGALAVASLVLLSSKAFVDYGTSGLENPLTYLLLAGLAWSLAGEVRVALVALLGGLLVLNRPDAALLALPAVTWAMWTRRELGLRSLSGALMVGATPLLAWAAFALVYYGTPIPNTAYAKLGAGLPRGEMIAQSGWYFAHAALHDPVTLLTLVAGMAVGFRGGGPSRALAAGVALYVAYIAWIGGDFMAGRFFAAPVFLSALVLADQSWPSAARIAAPAAFGASLLLPYAPLRSGRDYEKTAPLHGVVDERGYYHKTAGFFGPKPGAERPDHGWVREGRAARKRGETEPQVRPCVGYFGYFAGPKVRVVDRLGLADPLLSRLPMAYDPGWRIGHFRREVPKGYLEPGWPATTRDAELAAFAERVALVTQGPLFSGTRLAAVAELLWSPRLDRLRFRFPHAERRSLDGLLKSPKRAKNKAALVPPGGFEVALPVGSPLAALDLELSPGSRARLVFGQGEVIVGEVDARAPDGQGWQEVRVGVPGGAVRADRVFVVRLRERGEPRLGALRLVRGR